MRTISARPAFFQSPARVRSSPQIRPPLALPADFGDPRGFPAVYPATMKTPNTTQGRAEALQKLRDLVNDINFAMLTTVASDGSLRSRPMATLQFDSETGVLWFFTALDSPKTDEIAGEHQVGLSYASVAKQDYVSISGRARIVRDRAKIAELWTPMAKIWFPTGVDDPRLALLRVEIEAAEYWDSPSGMMVELYGLAKLALTGKPPKNTGENVKIDLPLRERPRY